MDSEEELDEFLGEDLEDDEQDDYYGSELQSKSRPIGRHDEASELYDENFIVDSDFDSEEESSEIELPVGASQVEIDKEKERK